jgi:hypothetical protein
MPADGRQWLGVESRDAMPPTGAQRVAAAEQHLAAIDAELARVEGQEQ